MSKRAFLITSVSFVVMLAFVARIYCFGAQQVSGRSQPPAYHRWLPFGQSVAIADFDGDDFADKATLGGAGHRKSLEIRLSHNKTRTVISFDTLTTETGSLLTDDVDNDGDYDLIWTDLVHPESVVIWLDDGNGRFERSASREYRELYVFTRDPVIEYPGSNQQDVALGSDKDPSTGLTSASKTQPLTSARSYHCSHQLSPTVERIIKPSLDRGPPALFFNS